MTFILSFLRECWVLASPSLTVLQLHMGEQLGWGQLAESSWCCAQMCPDVGELSQIPHA